MASVNFLYGRFSKFVSAVSIQKSIQTPYTFFRKVIRFFWRAKTKKARLHFIIKLFSAALQGSNLESPDPESGVLPITLRGNITYHKYRTLFQKEKILLHLFDFIKFQIRNNCPDIFFTFSQNGTSLSSHTLLSDASTTLILP